MGTAQHPTFDLDYHFEGGKDVFTVFENLKNFYRLLHDFDAFLLQNIHPEMKTEYRLESVACDPIRTRVTQVLKGVPDFLLLYPEVPPLLDTLLLRSKLWLLYKLSGAATIDSKAPVEALAGEINKVISEVGRLSHSIVHTVSPHAVLNALDDIAREVNRLPRKEAFRYRSAFGEAVVKGGIVINRPKILAELGQRTESSETREVVKPKKVDFVGDSKWEFILNGRTEEIKIEEKAWLEAYHRREIDIDPGDSLQVLLRTTYSYSANFMETRKSFMITRILGVIKPESNAQLMF
ncbi:hypothetical protein V9K67_09280 [Paraflavisolibacter sp. H34]|uniref:hypothetical protein n=1 Tax=Huijunlia imazamoxiresistens TaxID=3127457 RepID=UPI003015A3A8